jgi:hypothetical protein
MYQKLYYGGIILAVLFALLTTLYFFWKDIPGTIAYFRHISVRKKSDLSEGMRKTGSLTTTGHLQTQHRIGRLPNPADQGATMILDAADNHTEILNH